MARFPILVSLVLLLACGGADPVPIGTGGGGAGGEGPTVGGGGAAATPSLEQAFAAHGMSAAKGAFGFIDIANCCDSFCFGNNPSSPYAAVRLPPGPGQTAANPAAGDDGLSSAWRLRADEAVVVMGKLPPTAKYTAFTPYLYDRADPALPEGRAVLFASLGDSLNHLVMQSSEPEVFGGEVILVMAADAAVEAAVREALVAAGRPASVIHSIPLRTDVTALGLQEEEDSFALMQRVALFEDEALGAAYLADPAMEVLRVTPDLPRDAEAAYGAPTLRPPGTGEGEEHLAPALAALEAAILAAHPGMQTLALEGATATIDGDSCIANGSSCAGDNRDARYSNTALFQFQDDDEVVIYGVNHELTGKASYSNFAVTALQKLAGVDGASSLDFPGSAVVYLPDHPEAAQLYAFHMRRDCDDAPFCISIPKGCPGVPTNGLALITFRAYLEPATQTAPAWEELLPNRAIRFRP